MIGNIFISSTIILTLMLFSSAMYKSYSEVQEAKQIQEQYEIIKDIKRLLSKQYNINPEDITRDEIIALLPTNWNGVLKSDRKNISFDSQVDLLDEKANIILDEKDKIKLLALRAKLKNISTNNGTLKNNKYIFEVGNEEKNFVNNTQVIEKSITKAINYLYYKLKLSTNTQSDIEINTLNIFTPFNYIYADFTNKTQNEITNIKKDIFKEMLKKQIKKESNIEERILNEKNLFQG